MIARVRKALDEKEQGFTLVELLVVVIIIGILSAIAIPLYMNQQAKAKDSAAKTDLANLRLAVVSVLTENPTADTVTVGDGAGVIAITPATGGTDGTPENFQASPGVTITGDAITVEAAPTFCLAATVAGGKVGTFSTNGTGMLFESADCS